MSLRLLALVGLFIGIGSCRAQGAIPLVERCKDVSGDAEALRTCLRGYEADFLREHQDLVWRRGDTLLVRVPSLGVEPPPVRLGEESAEGVNPGDQQAVSDQPLTFVDDAWAGLDYPCSDEPVVVVLPVTITAVSYIAQPRRLVLRVGRLIGEEVEYLMINPDTGDIRELSGMPLVSPDGGAFLTVPTGLDHRPPGSAEEVAVYRLGFLDLEVASFSVKGWRVERAAWSGASTAEFTLVNTRSRREQDWAFEGGEDGWALRER